LVTDILYAEGDVPNVKRMCVVEEEVSLSQPETVAVPLEEEEVLVP
jgi:stress response protein YsnF